VALIAVTYVKGRPGVTTTALGLAFAAPATARPVLVECDPAGGDLMRRHQLAARPGLVDLAAAARTPATFRTPGAVFPPGTASPPQPVEVLDASAQQLRLGRCSVPVVVAPAGGAQTRAALPELTRAGPGPSSPYGGGVLSGARRLVVADCGRCDPVLPSWPVLRAADVVVLLARARADDLAHVREQLGGLLDAVAGRLVVVLAPGGAYPASEVAEVLTSFAGQELGADPSAVGVAGPLPADRRAAGVLGGELLARRGWLRLPLMSALARLLELLRPALPAPAAADRPGPVGVPQAGPR
jgi:hypothetical protein